MKSKTGRGMSKRKGMVRALAVRPGDRRPMIEVTEGKAKAGKGFEGDPRAKGKRGLTLLSTECWVEATRELHRILPWHTRRANILVEGLDLSATIGRRLRIGEVTLHVYGPTTPCAEMDELHPGLWNALKPDMRGGVYGEVLNDGIIRLGHSVEVLRESQ